jgi:hypothetical protein
MRKCLLVSVCPLLYAFLLVTSGFGQAWVPPKGQGEFSMAYQDLYTTDHFLGDGSRIDRGKIRLLGLIQGVDYGLTDKLALTAAFPIGMGKYDGRFPHQVPIDNGNYHGTIQDLGLTVRYNLRTRPLAFTPFIGTTFPSHHYEHFAHSAVGSRLWEIRGGVNIGRRLAFLPNTYFQMQYSYAISQRVLGIRPNRSRVASEFGYFMTRRLAVRALANSQITHGGLDFPEDFPSTSPTDVRWRHHDQIARIDDLNLGGGANFALTKSLDVFGSLVHTVWGANGHALKTGLTIGVSWSFRAGRAAPQMALADSNADFAWRNKPVQVNPCH